MQRRWLLIVLLAGGLLVPVAAQEKPAKPDAKPEAKPEAKPQAKPDAKPQKPDDKPATKPETKPAKPDDKPAKPDDKPAEGKPVELAWKFNKGDKFYQEMVTKTTQSMTIMNQPVKQEQDQTFLFSWTVKEVGPPVVIEQKIEAVKMTIRIGNNNVSYDSVAKDAADNPLSSFFKPLVGASFTLTLDPATMKVAKIEGRDEFVKKLGDANPTMGELLKKILSEEQLKQMTEPAFAVVAGKDKNVKVGDTWDRSNKLNMGPIGSYDATYKYTYRGTEKRGEAVLHKIELSTDLKYTPPDPKEASTLPFKIEGGTLKATKATGTIYFDADKGRVVESNMTVNLEGTLTISVADQKAEVALKQEQNTTAKTMDKNPYEAVK